MANYVVCGNLTINGDLTVRGTMSDVRNLSSLIKKLEKGVYKDIMELTGNKRTVEDLEVDDLILINFECKDKSDIIIMGSSISMNMELLEN